jgi:hypothetical protein
MRFTLTIDCDTAAFGDTFEDRQREVARILEDVSRGVGNMTASGTAKDANGNTVGRFGFEEAQEREVFYFGANDADDSQPSGWYFRPGRECIDGDGPFPSREAADRAARE